MLFSYEEFGFSNYVLVFNPFRRSDWPIVFHAKPNEACTRIEYMQSLETQIVDQAIYIIKSLIFHEVMSLTSTIVARSMQSIS